MKKGIKITLFVLLANLLIISCSQDPKIEYVEVPVCPNPEEHGQGDECECSEYPELGYECESYSVRDCLKATSDSIKAVVNLSQNCNCNDKNLCANETVNSYTDAALEAWGERGDGKTHILTGTHLDITYEVRLRNENTGRLFYPCLGTTEHTTAATAAKQNFLSRH